MNVDDIGYGSGCPEMVSDEPSAGQRLLSLIVGKVTFTVAVPGIYDRALSRLVTDTASLLPPRSLPL